MRACLCVLVFVCTCALGHVVCVCARVSRRVGDGEGYAIHMCVSYQARACAACARVVCVHACMLTMAQDHHQRTTQRSEWATNLLMSYTNVLHVQVICCSCSACHERSTGVSRKDGTPHSSVSRKLSWLSLISCCLWLCTCSVAQKLV